MERAAGHTRVPDQRVRQAPMPQRVQRHPIAALQRSAGNRAVAGALAPIVQRVSVTMADGGQVTDTDGPNSNRRDNVLALQDRLLALWSIEMGGYDEDRKRIQAKKPGDKILAGDIPHTLRAITRNEGPHLAAQVALVVFRAALLGSVGVGQTNDVGDVDLLLDIMHEEWHITNKDYDDSRKAIKAATTMTIDPATLPGFLDGLTKLKRYYAAGYPFRGSMRTRTSPLIPGGGADAADYRKAIAHNMAERDVLMAWLHEARGQTKDRYLRNSAEWFLSGRNQLYCLTATHDAVERAKGSALAGQQANFPHPGGPLGQPPALYRRKGKGPWDNTNVHFDVKGVAGFHSSGEIALIEPSAYGKKTVFSFMKHEAQHDADHSGSSDPDLYKTEFRAYWLDGTYDAMSPTKRVKRLGYTWNERQYAIFDHLYREATKAYPFVKRNWDANTPGWRSMVVAFNRPESVNPLNSVRLDDLRTAMTNCTATECLAEDRRIDAGQPPQNPKVMAVHKAIDALDELDRKNLQSNVELNQLALLNLGGRTRERYFRIR